MLHGSATASFARSSVSLVRRVTLVAALLSLVTVAAVPVLGQRFPMPPTDARTFLGSITGEWIGVCEQSTDGEKAEDKYFHAVVREVSPNKFETRFDYYRLVNGSPLKVGASSISTTIGPDGVARNAIKGEGVVLVEEKPRNQRHSLTETLKPAAGGRLEGAGTGSISVSGMPLGLGKNGKIRDGKSVWTLSNGALTIQQSIKAQFRMLFLSKTFEVTASYRAQRGSDVAALMRGSVRTALRLSGNPSQRM